MPTYNYEIAKGALNEADKDRVLCIYVNTDQSGVVDWAKASTEFGSASVGSFKKTTQNMMKKIDKAGGKRDGDGAASPAPVKPTPKKRKAAAEEDSEKPKKKGRKTKKEKEAEAAAAGAGDGDDEETAEGGATVKKEDDHGELV